MNVVCTCVCARTIFGNRFNIRGMNIDRWLCWHVDYRPIEMWDIHFEKNNQNVTHWYDIQINFLNIYSGINREKNF